MRWDALLRNVAPWVLLATCVLAGCDKDGSAPNPSQGTGSYDSLTEDQSPAANDVGANVAADPSPGDEPTGSGNEQADENDVTGASATASDDLVDTAPPETTPGPSETAPSDAGMADTGMAEIGAADGSAPAKELAEIVALESSVDGALAVGGNDATSQSATERAKANLTGDAKGKSKAAREPLFKDWPDPKVAIVLTGRQHGYLEPCGCAGLENMTGGLSRRATLMKELTKKGWATVPIDAGNQVRRFGRQPEIKFQVTIDGLRTMGYRAIAFGPDDLRLPAPELIGMMEADDPFVCANAVVLDPSFTSPFLVIEAGGLKIGVTSVLGARNQKKINSDEIILRKADEALKEVWPRLQEKKCNFYLLIAHATIEESIALAKQFPQFPIVVTTGGTGEPTRFPERIDGTKSRLIQVGTKGMYAGVIGLFGDTDTSMRYQRVPLDARFPDAPKMLQLLAAYQQQLEDIGLEGLGIRPQDHPSGLTFVGSKACEECHEEAYEIWKKGQNGHLPGHSKAFATLKRPPKRTNIPRQHDPECISCHVVGWNPQKYFPYKSGFITEAKTADLLDVGCENCHGPGSAHVAAENGDENVDDDELNRRRVQVQMLLEDAEPKCVICHDLDNSPHFVDEGVFEEYWEIIEH